MSQAHCLDCSALRFQEKFGGVSQGKLQELIEIALRSDRRLQPQRGYDEESREKSEQDATTDKVTAGPVLRDPSARARDYGRVGSAQKHEQGAARGVHRMVTW